MRTATALLALALANAAAAAPAAAPSPATPPPPRQPPYLVVQGEHDESPAAGQQLTVICPDGRKAVGAGYSALLHAPRTMAGAPATYGEGGLDQVRSMPDMGGSGWQVSGVSPDAVRLKQPWRLVVRVVCVQVAG